MPKPNAIHAAMLLTPEYREAHEIGIARKHLASLTRDEKRITAYLWDRGLSDQQLAALLGITPRAIRERLQEWEKLAQDTTAL